MSSPSAPAAAFSKQPRNRVWAAVAASAVTVVVAHIVNLLAFFIGNGLQASTLGQANLYFLPTSLLCFVFLAIFFFFGCARYWYATVLGGLVSSMVAAFLGANINVLMTGSAITLEVIVYVLGTLTGVSLIYLIAVTIVALTAGRRIYWATLAFRPGAATESRRVLVRAPSPQLSEGIVTHIERAEVNVDLADEQWDRYLAVFAEHGWTPQEVEAAPELPDSVFIEDTAVVFGKLAVITNPGAAGRGAEILAVETALRDSGCDIAYITEPGTLEGGDVLKVGSTVYVGRSSRTNSDGIRQLRALVRPLGYTVVTVPITNVLHLKNAATALPDGTVIGYASFIDDPRVFDRFLSVPEISGSRVVVLDDDTVLMAASAPRTAMLLTELGYGVVVVDISEFEKVEGSVTCLSVRLR